MGWVGKVHVHDHPQAALKQDVGRVWECSCGERFLNDAGFWIKEDSKVKFVLEEDINVEKTVS